MDWQNTSSILGAVVRNNHKVAIHLSTSRFFSSCVRVSTSGTGSRASFSRTYWNIFLNFINSSFLGSSLALSLPLTFFLPAVGGTRQLGDTFITTKNPLQNKMETFTRHGTLWSFHPAMQDLQDKSILKLINALKTYLLSPTRMNGSFKLKRSLVVYPLCG